MKQCKLLEYRVVSGDERSLTGSAAGTGSCRVWDHPAIEEDLRKYLNQGYTVKQITAGAIGNLFVYLEREF